MPFTFLLPQRASLVVDVVFVHGLRLFAGAPETDWKFQRGGPTETWPECLQQDLMDIRVGFLSYDAPASKWAGSAMHLEVLAVNLLDALRREGVGDRPVVFVTHSMGGLVVKEILMRSKDRSGDLGRVAKSCLGVVFLATPHYGSPIASAGVRLSIFRPSKALRALQSQDEHLTQLQARYADWVAGLDGSSQRIEHLVLSESELTKGQSVVPNWSADPRISGVETVPVNANHSTIASPKNRDAEVYTRVKLFVENVAERARDAAGKQAAETAKQLDRVAMKERVEHLEVELRALREEENDLLERRNNAENNDWMHIVHSANNALSQIDVKIKLARAELQRLPDEIKARVRADEALARVEEEAAGADEAVARQHDDIWNLD